MPADEHVLERLQGGADLMLPGVIKVCVLPCRNLL